MINLTNYSTKFSIFRDIHMYIHILKLCISLHWIGQQDRATVALRKYVLLLYEDEEFCLNLNSSVLGVHSLVSLFLAQTVIFN